MDQYENLDLPHDGKQDCFFTKLLKECSMDIDEKQPVLAGSEKDAIDEQLRKSKQEQKLPIQEFMRWKGLEESDDQNTYEPQPQLIRAQSLRLQQERKISTFMQIFGKNGDPITGQIKTFSPQKRKKIIKGKK